MADKKKAFFHWFKFIMAQMSLEKADAQRAQGNRIKISRKS